MLSFCLSFFLSLLQLTRLLSLPVRSSVCPRFLLKQLALLLTLHLVGDTPVMHINRNPLAGAGRLDRRMALFLRTDLTHPNEVRTKLGTQCRRSYNCIPWVATLSCTWHLCKWGTRESSGPESFSLAPASQHHESLSLTSPSPSPSLPPSPHNSSPPTASPH
jgi:hypothetical protein